MADKFDKFKDMSFVERTTDFVNVYGPTNKYNEWLKKSDKKVNPHSFAGRFLKVSFWISTLISVICFITILIMGFTNMGHTGGMTEAGQLRYKMIIALVIPLCFTTAIKILRSRYYGLYKLLWLFPLVMWGILSLVFVAAVSEETMEQIVDFIAKIFNLS